MKMNYKLTINAEEDFENILRYTYQEWGRKQAQKYHLQMKTALATIGEDPEALFSRTRNDIFPGCRTFSFGKHRLAYYVAEDVVIVLRILHEKMDIDKNLQ